MSLYDLKGRRALVTGSYRGLGIVLSLGLVEAGATVILNGRNESELKKVVQSLRANGYDVHGYAFDITDEAKIDEVVGRIEKEIGTIDILVNNAGIQKRVLLHETTFETWQNILTTNLTGAFLVSRRVVRRMIKRQEGKIINMCSTDSEVGRQGIGPYTAAKGGLRMLTRAMCADWAHYNIQINGISPGYFITDMTKALAEDQDFDAWVKNRTPAGRWGNPKELIGVLLLLSSDASSFINGQVIIVDGGVLATM